MYDHYYSVLLVLLGWLLGFYLLGFSFLGRVQINNKLRAGDSRAGIGYTPLTLYINESEVIAMKASRIKISYEKNINNHLDVLIKHEVSENISIDPEDLFNDIENGFTFIYDDDMGGEIDITFGESENESFVLIESDYAFDVITLYEIVESVINRVEA